MKFRLGQWERRILLQSLVVRADALFNRLENDTMDLDVMEYFEQYYKRLYALVYAMEKYYPPIDVITNDLETLERRLQMQGHTNA